MEIRGGLSMDYSKPNLDQNIFRQMKQGLNEEGFTPDGQLLSSLIHSLPLNVFAKDREGNLFTPMTFIAKAWAKPTKR